MEKRALVLEDEPAIARVLKQILTADAFDVDLVPNGNLACEILNEKTYDLCILNIHLPGMNGMEFYDFLKREKPELSMKTLIITGDVLGADTEAFLQDTKRPFLLKPFTPDELRTVIQDIMNSL